MSGSETDAFLPVKWPVVTIGGHDVQLFEEPGDLQGLEEWMAYQEGLEFYDAKGRRLRSFVALHGVDVMVPDASHSQADRIVKILREYLHAAGRIHVFRPRLSGGSLVGLRLRDRSNGAHRTLSG